MPSRRQPTEEYVMLIFNLPFQPGTDSASTWKPVKDLVRIVINTDESGRVTQEIDPGKVNVREVEDVHDGVTYPFALCSLKGDISAKRAINGIAGNSWYGFTLSARLYQIVNKQLKLVDHRWHTPTPAPLEGISPIKDEALLQRPHRPSRSSGRPLSSSCGGRGRQSLRVPLVQPRTYKAPANQQLGLQITHMVGLNTTTDFSQGRFQENLVPASNDFLPHGQIAWAQEQISNALQCHVMNSGNHFWTVQHGITSPFTVLPNVSSLSLIPGPTDSQTSMTSQAHTLNGASCIDQIYADPKRHNPHQRNNVTMGQGLPPYDIRLDASNMDTTISNVTPSSHRIIIVENLGSKVTEAAVKALFSATAIAERIKLNCDRNSNDRKCTAVVTFKTPEQAKAVMDKFQKTVFQSKRIFIYTRNGDVTRDGSQLEDVEDRSNGDAGMKTIASEGPVIANGSDEEVIEGTPNFKPSS